VTETKGPGRHTPGQTTITATLSRIRAGTVLPPYAKPHWCDWCAMYHPKFYPGRLQPDGQWECPGEFDARGRLRPHCADCAS
jgi:hypothetical protein